MSVDSQPLQGGVLVMTRRRWLACGAVVLLVLALTVAPSAVAADGTCQGPGSLWTSVRSWAQGLLPEWLAWSEGPENSEPVSTYDRLNDGQPTTTESDKGPGRESPPTTDDGDFGDPDG